MTSFRGNRPIIAIVGRCNSGKSSLLNFIIGQKVAMVSATPGTTADPLSKPFELLPLGPVTFYDTAGLDEASQLGRLRQEAARQIMDKADMAIIVTDQQGLTPLEKQAAHEFKAHNTPFLIVFNKADIAPPAQTDIDWCENEGITCLSLSALKEQNPGPLRQALLELAPERLWQPPPLVADLLPVEPLVVCVTPIDSGAPAGRLIAPQVQVIRELVDMNGQALVLQPAQLNSALSKLKVKPDLVITDSQALAQVNAVLPDETKLTTFSLLFARQKGDFSILLKGAAAIAGLPPQARVLIAEACSHHSQQEDIGRVKLPAWLEQYVGHKLDFHFYAGQDFPRDLEQFKLVLHCGGCMLTYKAMQQRLAACGQVPVTNYGMAIAQTKGLLSRITRIFQ